MPGPLWELASELEDLSISQYPDPLRDEKHEEVSEEQLASFEPPTSMPLENREAINDLHCSIVSRTVVAAARGGHLRRLVGTATIHVDQAAFAVRTLLPFWEQIKDWERKYKGRSHGYSYPRTRWAAEAATLRPTLAHASIWLLDAKTGAKRDIRLLTQGDVTSLAAYFRRIGIPQGLAPKYTQNDEEPPSVPVHLTWLEEDSDLAQQVAEVWNAVAQRREADFVKCRCKECKLEVGEDADAAAAEEED